MVKKIALFVLLLALTAGCGAYEDTNNVSGNEPTGQEENQAAEKSAQDIQDELARQMEQSGLEVGSRPPALNIETLNGELFDEETLKGKKVIINFWATWCGPCRLEMPDIIRVAEENPDDLVVVAVNLNEDNETVEAFVEELGMQDFQVLLDRKDKLAKQFQIIAVPTTYFLNTDGKIAHKHIGFMNYAQLVQTYNNLN